MDSRTIEKIDKVYMWNYGISKADFLTNAAHHRKTSAYKMVVMAVNYAEAFEHMKKQAQKAMRVILNAKKAQNKFLIQSSYKKKKSQKKNWHKWKDKKA